MKKLTLVFFLICFISAICINIQFNINQTSSFNKSFLISNNQNGVFDGTLTKESNVLFEVPSNSPAIPFENEIYNMDMDFITEIKPYYSYYMYVDELGSNNHINYWVDNNNKIYTKSLPINLENKNFNLSTVQYKVVFDDEKFMYKHQKEGVIIKSFETDSGVFIAQPIFEYLDVDINAKNLTLEVPVLVPVIAEMKEGEIHSSTYSYSSLNYTVSKYETIYVTLEVEGVIKTEDVGLNFCQGLGIVIPYDLSKEIYDSVDRLNLVLKEDQFLYEPNVYYVECTQETKMGDIGFKLLNKIGPVYIQEYEYDDSHYFRINVYNENETLYYPR